MNYTPSDRFYYEPTKLIYIAFNFSNTLYPLAKPYLCYLGQLLSLLLGIVLFAIVAVYHNREFDRQTALRLVIGKSKCLQSQHSRSDINCVIGWPDGTCLHESYSVGFITVWTLLTEVRSERAQLLLLWRCRAIQPLDVIESRGSHTKATGWARDCWCRCRSEANHKPSIRCSRKCSTEHVYVCVCVWTRRNGTAHAGWLMCTVPVPAIINNQAKQHHKPTYIHTPSSAYTQWIPW